MKIEELKKVIEELPEREAKTLLFQIFLRLNLLKETEYSREEFVSDMGKIYETIFRISTDHSEMRDLSLRPKVMPYQPHYAEQTVQMWRDSKEQAIGQKEIHSFENHLYFLNHILHEQYQIELAILDEQVVGMIAFNESEISQLYIHVNYQKMGIGQLLLDRAKAQSNGRLTLYTFEVNENAQRFYEKNKFRIIGRGHENEENLPDILYEWIDK